MTKNYMFIDIDGPLLPSKSHMFAENAAFIHHFQAGMPFKTLIENHPPMFDPWCVRAHNLLAAHSDAKCVLVTNWRRWATNEELMQLFEMQGLKFQYDSDNIGCVKRGLSSERVHDVSEHLNSCLPDTSKALILDDANLQWLNGFHKLVGAGDVKQSPYGFPEHDDRQVGMVTDDDGNDRDIRWKWLDISLQDGITFAQFKIALDFFDIDYGVMKADLHK